MTRTLVRTILGKKPGGTFDPIAFTKSVAKLYKRKSVRFTTKKSFSPSGIVYGNGKCPRYWFYAFSGADFLTNVDAKGGANMLNGTYVHDRLQKLMLDAELISKTEVEVKYDDPPIRGFIDVVIENEEGDVIGEIKSARNDTFEAVVMDNSPKLYHMIQVLIYMYITDTKDGFVMYENKDNQELLVLPVILNDRTKKIVEDIFEWMREVKQAHDDDKMPDRVFSKTSYACAGCPVKKQCWSDERVDIEIGELKF